MTEHEHPRTHLPDAAYLARAAARQAPFALALAAVMAPLATVYTFAQKNRFDSAVAAVYDNRDSAETIPRYPYYPRFPQVADAFRARLDDAEFLWQLAREVGLTRRTPSQGPVSSLLNKVLRAQTAPEAGDGRELPDDSRTKAELAVWMRSLVSVQADEKKDMLGLVVSADDPLTARKLADTAMELFIQSELRFEAESYQRLHEAYSSYLAGATLPEPAAPVATPAPESSSEQDRLRKREAELIERLQVAKTELDSQRGRDMGARAALEAELARLATKLTPNHPDVIAKRDELKALGGGDDAALKARVAQLRQSLNDVRDQQRKLGMAVGTGEGKPQVVAQRSNFLPALADRVSELDLERQRLVRQIDDPRQRTRLRVVAPATYSELPAVDARSRTGLGLGILCAFVACAAGAFRELRSPFARDFWRVAWRCRETPLLAEVPRAVLKRWPRLTVEQAAHVRRQPSAGEALRSYRRVEAALRRHCQGQVVHVVTTGDGARSGDFLHNLVNLTAADAGGPVLVIDCDARDPVAPADERLSVAGDLPSFLAGKHAWKDVRAPKSDARAYDLVPAAADGAPPLKADALARLNASLVKSYARIYVRSHDARNLLENPTLLQAASDGVVCLDGRAATFRDLDDALAALDPAKRRGVVLIGS